MSALTSAQTRVGELILVNRAHGCEPLPVETVPFSTGENTVSLHPKAAAALEALLRAVGGEREIVPVSGWRSQAEQQSIWDGSLAEHGPTFTRTFVAYPGHSEHQTGLAVDLARRAPEIDFLCPDFPHEGLCQAFRERAASFGFIERYPAGKESVTGIGAEPWHFRYVGLPHALFMAEHAMVLEEYLTFLRQYRHGSTPLRLTTKERVYSLTYLPAEALGTYCVQSLCSISGDNMGGCVVTAWEELPCP